MKNVIVLGDPTTHGGNVITASSNITISGRPAALVGDAVSCPKDGLTIILEGSKTVFDKGKALAIDGSLCGCGCKVIASINKMPIA